MTTKEESAFQVRNRTRKISWMRHHLHSGETLSVGRPGVAEKGQREILSGVHSEGGDAAPLSDAREQTHCLLVSSQELHQPLPLARQRLVLLE